jgi:hypothetical protein
MPADENAITTKKHSQHQATNHAVKKITTITY